MCTRGSQHSDLVRIRDQFGPLVGDTPNAAPRWNAAPTDTLLVVRRHPETRERRLDVLRWGLIPPWAKDIKIGTSAINARSETIEDKAMFRAPWQKGKRCLIPFDSFFEWKKEGKLRHPYAVATSDGGMLGLAGLWEGWRSPEGEIVRSFTILTTSANALLDTIHERMPVVIPPDRYETWLAGTVAEARDLLSPYPADALRMWAVSPAMNKVGAIDDQSCVAPMNPL